VSGGEEGAVGDLMLVGRGGEDVVAGAVVVEVGLGGTEEEGSRSISLASSMPVGGGIGVPGWGGGGAMPLLPGGGPGGGGGKPSSASHHSSEPLHHFEADV